jgi:hypothetical protein
MVNSKHPFGLTLTSVEEAQVKSVEAQLSQRARFPMTLSSLVERWSDFVGEVEGGYSSSVDEYTNDLTSRDLIDQVRESLPESVQFEMMTRIGLLDERFKLATQPDIKKALSSFFAIGPAWWWARIPIKRSRQYSSELKLDD